MLTLKKDIHIIPSKGLGPFRRGQKERKSQRKGKKAINSVFGRGIAAVLRN